MQRPLIILVLMAALAAACSGPETAEDSSPPTDEGLVSDGSAGTTTLAAPMTCAEPLVVGVVTDLSGGSELFGSQLSRGVSIGMAFAAGGEPQEGAAQTYRVDACDIRVVIGDDQSNPAVAAIVARKLIEEDGAAVLIGSVGQDTTAAIAEVADEAKVVLIATTDTGDGLAAADFNTSTFLLAPSVDQEAMAQCDHLVVDQGASRLAQVAPDYGFGHRTAAARREACEALGAEFVVGDVLAPAGARTFETVLEPIVAVNPDALLIAWTGGGLKALAGTAADEGLQPATVFGAHLLVPVFFSDGVGMTSPVAYHHKTANNASNSYLIDRVGSATGLFPDIHDARGMAAAILVVAAAQAADEPGSLGATLEGISVVGPGGPIEMRSADHLSIQDIPIVKLVNAAGPDYFDPVSSTRPEPPCRLVGEHEGRCPG